MSLYGDIIINMVNQYLMIFGSQTVICYFEKNAFFWGATVSHFMDHNIKMSSILNLNTSAYRQNDTPTTRPPTSSRTLSNTLTLSERQVAGYDSQ